MIFVICIFARECFGKETYKSVHECEYCEKANYEDEQHYQMTEWCVALGKETVI